MSNSQQPLYFSAVCYVIWIMLIMYVLPVYAVVFSAIVTKGFSNEHFILAIFSSLVSTADDSYSIFHRVLIPLIAAFSVIAFRDRATSSNALGLIAFIVASIVFAIGLNLFISSKGISANLIALKSSTFEFNFELASSFLNHVQEVLGTFLMMLLGLQASDSVMLRG